jgi:hypothetical protein
LAKEAGFEIGSQKLRIEEATIPCCHSPFFPESAHTIPFAITTESQYNPGDGEDSRPIIIPKAPVQVVLILSLSDVVKYFIVFFQYFFEKLKIPST